MKIETQYLSSSDETYSWFVSYYELVDENLNQIIYINDLYDLFKNSAYYENMTKLNKRIFNKTKFNDLLCNNLFMQNLIKPARSYYNKVRQTKDYILNYRRIVEDNDNDNDNDNKNIYLF